MTSRSGILFVTSRIKSPPPVDLATYTHWYNDIHLPDLIHAASDEGGGGAVLATRNKSLHPRADLTEGLATAEVPFPFLSLDKLVDLTWVTTAEFLSVPHTSEVLPAEVGHDAFGCFDVQLRSYMEVARSLEQGGKVARFIVTCEMASMDMVKEMLDKDVGKGRGYICYELVEGLLEYEQKDMTNKGFFIAWFDETPKLSENSIVNGAQAWELIFEYGKKNFGF